jgi:hypothetical protein
MVDGILVCPYNNIMVNPVLPMVPHRQKANIILYYDAKISHFWP